MSEFDFQEQLRELLSKYYMHSKSIERELYKSELKYRSLLEQLTDAIYFTDFNFYIWLLHRIKYTGISISWNNDCYTRGSDVYWHNELFAGRLLFFWEVQSSRFIPKGNN